MNEEGEEGGGDRSAGVQENIEHHIEEEEGEMFKLARTLLSQEQLEELGVRMQELQDRKLRRAE